MPANDPAPAGEAAPRYAITVPRTGERFDCAAGEPILRAMARLGRKGIPAGCLNGGCGVCKVRIVAGRCHATGPVSREHVSAAEAELGCTLACRAAPDSDIELEVLGRMQKGFFRT